MFDTLPSRVFISHAFADVDAVADLVGRLPESVTPEIFAKQEADPTRAVSNGILPRILECEGLVYLTRGASQRSFWVSFERDYALRAGRQVFRWDPLTESLTRDRGRPHSLGIEIVFHASARAATEDLLHFVNVERHVALGSTVSRTPFGGIKGSLAYDLEQLLIRGGVILWLGSRSIEIPMSELDSPGFVSYVVHGEFREEFVEHHLDEGGRSWLDTDWAREAAHDFWTYADPYWFTSQLYARILDDLPPHWHPRRGSLIDVVSPDPARTPLHWNRVDDLIIRIYAATVEQERRWAASPPRSPAVYVDQIDELLEYWQLHPGSSHELAPQGVRLMPRSHRTNRFAGHALTSEAASRLNARLGPPQRGIVPGRFPTHDWTVDPVLPPDDILIWAGPSDFFELTQVHDGFSLAVLLRRIPYETLT